MSMKKALCAAFAGTLLLYLMAGCTAGGNEEFPQSGTSESASQEASQSSTSDGTRTPELPAEYQITYEMENGDGTLTLITMAKDHDGNLYYQAGSEQMWFLAVESGYMQAAPSEDGTLTAISTGTILKESSVRESTESFWDCVETSQKLIAPGFSNAGSATVAERNCDLYTNAMGVAGMNVTYQLYIDQETGICLGWTEEKETGIFSSDPSEGTFLCTEFLTDTISLPTA